MDLTQNKLTKSEWETIEIPVSSEEKKILEMRSKGYDKIDTKYNFNLSLLSIPKLHIKQK